MWTVWAYALATGLILFAFRMAMDFAAFAVYVDGTRMLPVGYSAPTVAVLVVANSVVAALLLSRGLRQVGMLVGTGLLLGYAVFNAASATLPGVPWRSWALLPSRLNSRAAHSAVAIVLFMFAAMCAAAYVDASRKRANIPQGEPS